ncbi:hypothetical protein DSO57_1021625 [Entomophthora muscae]|uniref:Uncharacterized protein n=1 Tax=Entomophthora muscae TaxID=34485 RepID=A0ACC2S5G7_9FUNG|nr:hypothetical protein DSO57_1021625 [Entomophthora muscae]
MQLIWLVGECLGASILLHSGGSTRSHIKAMLEVGQTLAERGHAVRYVAMDDNLPYADGYNITAVGLGSKGAYRSTFAKIIDTCCKGKMGQEYNRGFASTANEWLSECYQHEYMPLLKHIQNDPPALMVCDLFANPCIEMAEQKGIPLVIGIQALDYLGIFNAPYVANDPRFSPQTIDQLSFGRRVFDSVMIPYLKWKVWKTITGNINQLRLKFGSNATWFPRGAFHYGVGLANSFVGFEAAQPLPPNIKLVGPILSQHPPPLDESLTAYLLTHNRVLFVAFGSLLSLQPPELTRILNGALEAMERGHIDGLIWGLGKTLVTGLPSKHDFLADSRFLFLPWAPQQAILNHPHTILFLSHGGLESCFEAMHSRTPVLTLPFFGDQEHNSRKLYDLGVGFNLDPFNIDIASSIDALLSRPTLASSLDKAQALINPHRRRREEAANYIEDHLEMAQACRPHFPYIPGSGTPPCELSHLLPASTHMSYFTANRVDVYLFLFIMVLATASAIASLIYSTLLRPPNEPRLKSE